MVMVMVEVTVVSSILYSKLGSVYDGSNYMLYITTLLFVGIGSYLNYWKKIIAVNYFDGEDIEV